MKTLRKQITITCQRVFSSITAKVHEVESGVKEKLYLKMVEMFNLYSLSLSTVPEVKTDMDSHVLGSVTLKAKMDQ